MKLFYASQTRNYQGSISPTFYKQLLRADPKSAIKLLNLTVFSALLGSACVKAAPRMLVKLIPMLLLPQSYTKIKANNAGIKKNWTSSTEYVTDLD